MNFSKVILEGDAIVIINAVNREEEAFSSYGNIIQEIKKHLYDRKEWEVRFINREKNTVVPTLVKVALQYENERIWIEEAPNNVVW